MSEIQGNYNLDVGLQKELTPKDIHNDCIEGFMKASKAYVLLRNHQTEINKYIKEIESLLVDEITHLDDKESLISLGYKIRHMKGRATYDFNSSSKWIELNNERKRLESLIKVATKENSEIVDKETGEIIEPVQIKHGKGFFKMEKA